MAMTTSAIAPATTVPMRTILSLTHSSLKHATTRVIESHAEWAELWGDMTGRHNGQSQSSAPPFDFQRERLLVASYGPGTTRGCRIEIVGVLDRGGVLVAQVRCVKGHDDAPGVAPTAVYPVHVVAIPAGDTAVEFDVQR
jgi:hypothetical protein